jgi:hypothetical protein
MYTQLDTVYTLFETFFVYVKMKELFEVAELGGALCIIEMWAQSSTLVLSYI